MWYSSLGVSDLGSAVIVARILLPTLDVVGDEFGDGGWYSSLLYFVYESVEMDDFECLRHVQGFSDSAFWCFFWVKPVVIMLFIVCSAVVVKCLVLKPCWWDGRVMLDVIEGIMIFSSVLAMGERSAMSLYEEPADGSLPDLWIGIILTVFQMVSMLFLLITIL